MKNNTLFLFSFLVGGYLIISGFTSTLVPIPVDYSVIVSWNPGNCICGDIIEKELIIEVWDVNVNPDELIDADTIDITLLSSPYTYEESGSIIWNCQQCYMVRAKVNCYDNEELCCTGANSETCDGEDLIAGYPITVIMN